MPAAWVTADEAYGGDSKFRRWPETRRISYVVAVAHNQTIPATAGTSRADALLAQPPNDAWKRRSCGDGTKGPRLDHYQVRRYDARYRHVTLAMLAHTYLAVTAATAPKALAAASSQSRWARPSASWHT